jgi:hypothetical protein
MCDELTIKVLGLNDGEKGSRFKICNYNVHVMINLYIGYEDQGLGNAITIYM